MWRKADAATPGPLDEFQCGALGRFQKFSTYFNQPMSVEAKSDTTRRCDQLVSPDQEADQCLAGDKLQSGELEAFTPYLLAIANEKLRRDVRAKIAPSDVVQEALVEAVKHREDFRGGTTTELKYWLRRIVVNKIVDAHRHFCGSIKRNANREQTIDGPAPTWIVSSDSTPSQRIKREEQEQQLVVAIGRLSPDHREVVVLHKFDGLKFTEIAARTGRSAAAVRGLWCRAVQSLRNELE